MRRLQMLMPVVALVPACWLATANLPATAQATSPSGEQLYRQRCQACHAVVAERPAGVGPNLAGVVGRKAASTGYAYSPALKAANVFWDRDAIDRYLSGPSRMVPGTKMMVAVPDPSQRAAIIQYLAGTH